MNIDYACFKEISKRAHSTMLNWLFVDGYARSGIIGLIAMMNISRLCLKTDKILRIGGPVIFFFYLAYLIWLVFGVVIFRKVMEPNHILLACQENIKIYFICLFTLGLICTLLSMVLSWLRPSA